MPIDANDSSGVSGSPGGSAGFSRKLLIFLSAAASMMPKADASLRGTRIPATVAESPESMWASIICPMSMR